MLNTDKIIKYIHLADGHKSQRFRSFETKSCEMSSDINTVLDNNTVAWNLNKQVKPTAIPYHTIQYTLITTLPANLMTLV